LRESREPRDHAVVTLLVLLAALAGPVDKSPTLLIGQCGAAPVQRVSVMAAAQGRRRAVHHPAPFTPVTIDVAIGWTDQVLAHPSMGEAGARAFAEESIAYTNSVLRATGILHVTLRLVWSGRLGFDDVPGQTPQRALVWLNTDPEVAALRSDMGADLVWLVPFWTEPSYAPIPITEADFVPANGVSVINFLGGVQHAAHEFGHTLGLAHEFVPTDRPIENDPFPYRYAFYSTEGNFRDVMTTGGRCARCEVLHAFSTTVPWMTYRGFRTGGEKSDAARLIPFAAAKIAAYAE
jgi:hypothetical protein